MKIFLKNGVVVSILLLVLSLSNVYANNVFYTNSKGVEMNELQYNKMLQLFSERKMDLLTQEEFDKYKDSNIISNEVKYEKEVYKDKKLISTEEITEEEYNNAPEAEVTPYAGDSSVYETSYKRLGATITDGGGWSLLAALSWKKKPAYQSYDVFAFRLSNFNYSGFSGTQVYLVGNNDYHITYNTASEGYKAQSNGAGVSMNLKDGSDITGYELAITANLYVNTSSYSKAHVYVAYEHAQANVTRAQSMSYTLDVNGYGNVVKFNSSSIANLYDGMDGVHLTANI